MQLPVGSVGREEQPRAVLQPALRIAELDTGPLKAQGTASARLCLSVSPCLGETGFESRGAKMTVLREIQKDRGHEGSKYKTTNS